MAPSAADAIIADCKAWDIFGMAIGGATQAVALSGSAFSGTEASFGTAETPKEPAMAPAATSGADAPATSSGAETLATPSGPETLAAPFGPETPAAPSGAEAPEAPSGAEAPAAPCGAAAC